MKVPHSLKISLHGMDDRMQIMMASYLELNCKGIACVVKESEAEAEIVDADLSNSKNLLQERLAHQPAKPIIVISLYDISSSEVIYVKKPIKVDDLVNAINKIKESLAGSVTDPKKTLEDENSGSSMPELPTLLKQNQQTDSKQSAKTKADSSAVKEARVSPSLPLTNKNTLKSAEIPASQEMGKDKPQSSKQPTKKNKSGGPAISSDVVSINSARPRPEIDKFLKEFDRSIKKKNPKDDSKSKTLVTNRRNTVRYVFQAITGSLKKNSLLGFNPGLPISVQAISSKGALIKLEKKLKLNRKVTLEIQLDSRQFFVIPATVIRQNSSTTYGLAFLDYQHKLTEYLISSGRSFNIK